MKKLTLIQKFSLLCVIMLVLFGVTLGWIVTTSLERNMFLRSKQITAQFVRDEIESEFALAELTTPKLGSDYDDFSEKVSHINLGPQVERIKIWNTDQVVVWSDENRLVGHRFPDNARLTEALSGKLVSAMSGLEEDEQIFEQRFARLLELYVPIRFEPGGEIKAVVEIYQDLSPLYLDISSQKQIVWISVILGLAVLYLLLFGIVWRASNRIEAQTEALQEAHDQLEKRVKERTAELIEANEQLQREIEERKRAEEALGESEKRYRTLFEKAGDAIFILEVEGAEAGKVVAANQASAEMHGYTVDELLALNIVDLDTVDTAQQAPGRIQRMLAGEWIKTEITHRKKDGTEFPVESSAGLLKLGVRNYNLAFYRDITQRKRAEEEIKLMQTATLAISETGDLISALGVVLEEVCETTGWHVGEAWIPDPGKEVLVHATSWNSHGMNLEEYVRLSKEFTFPLGEGLPGRVWASRQPEWIPDVSRKSADIFPRTAMAHETGLKAGFGVPIIDANEVQAVLAFFMNESREDDVRLVELVSTVAAQLGSLIQRKRAEEALRQARDMLEQQVKDRTSELVRTNKQLKEEIDERKQMEVKLRKSGERFQALTESTSDWIWEVNLNGTYTYASPKVKDLLGYVSGEIIGKTLFDFVPPEETKHVKSEFKTIVDSRKPFSKLEKVNIHKAGQLITLETSGVPVFDSKGQLCGYRGIDRDITEEEELRRESDYRLQQIIQADKLASLGEVVAGVAHEINNPNSFITYNIPLLEETWQMFEPLVSEYGSLHPERRISGLSIEELCGDMGELIQDIKIGSDRINKIVFNLKDFARLDESNQIKPVQVNEMIEKTMAIVGAQVRKSVGKIKMDLDPNLPKIQGHFQKLEQVVANLVTNAVHAIPDKDKGRLSVSTRHVGRLGSVLIEVEDNGFGMEQGVIERIFEPFFTTRRDVGGTGLGLSVSYGLIQEHNGIIGVLSRPGLGTRFTLYLPVNNGKKLDLRPSILCLDDDVEFLGLLKMYFVEVKNLSLETKNKPENVVEYLENHPEVDVVLSGVMPGKNGWELVGKIKARFPLLPVILYSSDLNAFKQKPDSVTGADHFLQKPFRMEYLLEIINTIGRQRL